MSTTKDEKVTSFLEDNKNEVDKDIQEMKCKSPQVGCIREEVEEESTSSFLVGDPQITAQGFGSCMGGEASFGLDPKEVHKSDLQSPFETHNEDENKATLLGCEAEILLEEQATIVSVQEDGNVKNMDNNSYNFCRSHVHLQPSDLGKYKNSSLAFEDYKRKTTCEGDKFTPSFPVGDHTISEKKGDIVNGEGIF